MATMRVKRESDWCHCCGARVDGGLVEVWYPRNAEHEGTTVSPSAVSAELTKYIRLCADCIGDLASIAAGDAEQLQVDRRAKKRSTPRTRRR